MDEKEKRRRQQATTERAMRRVCPPSARAPRRAPQSYTAPRPTAARVEIVAADLRRDERYEE